MKVPRDQLAVAIAKKTLHETSYKHLARAIAAYLLDEHRSAELEPLLRDVIQYRIDHGIVEAEIVSARELSAQVQADLATMLKEQYPSVKHVTLNPRLDKQVVGGVIVNLPNEQFDDSVRGRLSKFKRLIGAEGYDGCQ